METYKEGMYRIKVVSLEEDAVSLRSDSLNRFCEELFPKSLPEDVYTARILGKETFCTRSYMMAEDY